MQKVVSIVGVSVKKGISLSPLPVTAILFPDALVEIAEHQPSCKL